MTRRELALRVWWEYLGLPYVWGGDDPMTGFDCSGLVLEGLKSVGLFPRDEDTTADGLLRHTFGTLPRLAPDQLEPGCLLFWGSEGRATHVEIVCAMVNRLPLTLGASGGGSRTTSAEAAAAQNAYVKVRPARPGWIAAVDPF